MKSFEFITDILENKQINYEPNYSLAKFSTFKVGGEARLYVTPRSFRELKILQKIIDSHCVPFFFIGGGSNLLISDHGFDGVAIQLAAPEEIIVKKKTKATLWVRGRASNRSAWFAKTISNMGYAGLEFLSTVPGSLGGAVVQNSGCYGSEIKDHVAKIFTANMGTMKILQNEEADFSYRNSLFKRDKGVWVYAVDFKLTKGEPLEIRQKLEKFKNHRITSQPRNKKSAGSVFKNPIKGQQRLKAWQLIDKVNLRGEGIGGASFSEEHSNFIVNDNVAKASDIYQLILLAQKTVKEKTGVELKTEIVQVGNFE